MNTLIQKCTDIEEIMRPLLQKHDMTFFAYYKWYFNGNVLRLSTNSTLTDHFFKKDYINKLTVPKSYLLKPLNYYLWKENDCSEVLSDYAINFNTSNGISIAIRHADSIETFAFATTTSNTSIINNFYINNLDLLRNYCYFFKDKAKMLINECENNKIILKNPENSKLLFIPNTLSMQLTERQYACADLLLKGMKYKEIARELDISPRTVESHFRDLKIKLACTNKSGLISKLLQILPRSF